MLLGTEVGLGPGDIMLDGDPAPPPMERGTAVPLLFGPCLLWRNGWPSQLLLSSCCRLRYWSRRARVKEAVPRMSGVQLWVKKG